MQWARACRGYAILTLHRFTVRTFFQSGWFVRQLYLFSEVLFRSVSTVIIFSIHTWILSFNGRRDRHPSGICFLSLVCPQQPACLIGCCYSWICHQRPLLGNLSPCSMRPTFYFQVNKLLVVISFVQLLVFFVYIFVVAFCTPYYKLWPE